MLLAISERCEITVSADDRQRVAAAGQRIQDRIGMSDDEVDNVAQDIAGDVSRLDCGGAGQTFADVMRETLAEAERVQ